MEDNENAELLALQSLDEKSVVLQQEGKYLEALECMERGLVLRQHFFGAGSDEVWRACKTVGELCNLLAMTFLQQEDFNAVLELLKKAEILSERDDAGRAVTYNNFACYYRRLGKLHAALQYLQKALRIESRLGAEGNSPADTRLNMCAVLSHLGRHQQALTHAEAALSLLLEELFSPHSESATDDEGNPVPLSARADRIAVLAIAYHNIGVENEFLHKMGLALRAYRKGVEVAEAHLGKTHGIAITLRNSLTAADKTINVKDRKVGGGGGKGKRALRKTAGRTRGGRGRGKRGSKKRGAGGTRATVKAEVDPYEWNPNTTASTVTPVVGTATLSLDASTVSPTGATKLAPLSPSPKAAAAVAAAAAPAEMVEQRMQLAPIETEVEVEVEPSPVVAATAAVAAAAAAEETAPADEADAADESAAAAAATATVAAPDPAVLSEAEQWAAAKPEPEPVVVEEEAAAAAAEPTPEPVAESTPEPVVEPLVEAAAAAEEEEEAPEAAAEEVEAPEPVVEQEAEAEAAEEKETPEPVVEPEVVAAAAAAAAEEAEADEPEAAAEVKVEAAAAEEAE